MVRFAEPENAENERSGTRISMLWCDFRDQKDAAKSTLRDATIDAMVRFAERENAENERSGTRIAML